MHKCVNKSIGNIYHLEQMVGEFFPYSQEKLRFDKPVTIIFQSDKDNAARMLGKTAYYNPENYEVTLYTDNRHPKDIMRSLSHELVHHAQNCRGDFKSPGGTEVGYAQRDPHLRKMEREAYTKGNLIFRDFEDLIKTGKINVEIDFSKTGEPEMSLKEWKDNELNTLLMKKWGLLKESTYRDDDDELEEGSTDRDEDEKLDEIAPMLAAGAGMAAGALMNRDDDEEEDDEKDKKIDEIAPLMAAGLGMAAGGMMGGKKRHEDDDEDDAVGLSGRRQKKLDEILPALAAMAVPAAAGAAGMAAGKLMSRDDDEEEEDPADYTGTRRREKKAIRALKRGKGLEERARAKISVREAKEITRRIIERIKKESR